MTLRKSTFLMTGDIRIRFALNNKSWLAYSMHTTSIYHSDQNYSTNSGNSGNMEQTRFRKFVNIVKVFTLGSKALFNDVKMALKTRRKLGLYNYEENLINKPISREEILHMRQTRKDVVKTFPVTMLFMVPFLGYTAPIIAYFYPKQLLSQQFWHPDQKKDFVLEEYEKRSQYYLPLIKEVGITSKEIKDSELLNLCLETLNGKQPLNAELLIFKEVFSQHEDFSLQKMPRYHLVKLCQCWLVPTGWFLPRWFLVSSLRKRIARLHQDDALILRDGIHSLTSSCIEQAVHMRGLDESCLCDSAKLQWLTDWLNLSSQVASFKAKKSIKDRAVEAKQSMQKPTEQNDDVSFLAHCAIFKAANFETFVKNQKVVS